MSEPVLRLDDLTVALPSWSDRPNAVDGVSLEVGRNEVLCLVGESGSGKSVMAKAILRLLPAPHLRLTGGRILFEGRDLATLDDAAMRNVRGARIAMIFQEPMVALNPLMTVGRQTDELLLGHSRRTGDRGQSYDKAGHKAIEQFRVHGSSILPAGP